MRVIGDESFDELVLQGKGKSIVLFSASWCGPCKVVTPVFEKVSEELVEKISAFKVDVDVAHETAQWCGIKSVPTFVVFEGGAEITRIQGAVTETKMKEFLGSLAV